MKSKTSAGSWALIAVVVLVLFWSPSDMRVRAQSATTGPQFEVDPLWPKQLPERWVTGELGGVCVDANDHVFVLNRQDVLEGELNAGHLAPPIIELDAEGTVINSWGDPKLLDPRLHSCAFDADGNVWIAS